MNNLTNGNMYLLAGEKTMYILNDGPIPTRLSESLSGGLGDSLSGGIVDDMFIFGPIPIDQLNNIK
jgi:hypothetical protein